MLDLITIVFREELPLLEIQAESINQYFNPADINSITIVVNDTDDVADLIDRSWWKQYQHLVQIKCYSHWNYTSRINGWENQQLLKLLAASESTSKWGMVLDAKTWFVQSIAMDKLFGDNNLPNTGAFPGPANWFVEARKFVEERYNIKLPLIVGPYGVPFMFHTDTVRDLVNSEDNFIDFFQTNVRFPNLVTEFFLYSGFVKSKFGTIDTLYNTKYSYLQVVNLTEFETDQFDNFITRSQLPQTITSSLHRKTYAKLTQEQILTWVLFLKDKSLISNISNTVDLLNTYIK